MWLKVLAVSWLAFATVNWGLMRVMAAPGAGADDAAVFQALKQRFEAAPGVPSYLISLKDQVM
jgi:hypothetical protein